MTSSFFLAENFHFLQFSPFVIYCFLYPLYTLICISIVLCCLLMLKLKFLKSSYFDKLWKDDKLSIYWFWFAYWWSHWKAIDGVIIFETCDQVIFIISRLKIDGIKFHEFSIKRTNFMVICLLQAKNTTLPGFEKFKKAHLGWC